MSHKERRSFADLVSSDLKLSSLDFDRLFGSVAAGRFPAEGLPLFLHEAQHFACLKSLAGTGLAVLLLEALSTEEASTAKRSFLRFSYLEKLLAPLLEGLALFAEHDVLVGDAPIVSEPARWVALTSCEVVDNKFQFLQPAAGVEWLFTSLNAKLAKVRSSAPHVRRKADLLIRPLRGSQAHYLGGYLFVKDLWRRLSSTDDLIGDRDLYAHALMRAMFDDWGLLRRILNDLGDEDSWRDGVETYYFDRLRRLPELLRQPRLGEWVQRDLAGKCQRIFFSAGQFRTGPTAFPLDGGYFDARIAGWRLRRRLNRLARRAHALANRTPDAALGGSPTIGLDASAGWWVVTNLVRRFTLLTLGSGRGVASSASRGSLLITGPDLTTSLEIPSWSVAFPPRRECAVDIEFVIGCGDRPEFSMTVASPECLAVTSLLRQDVASDFALLAAKSRFFVNYHTRAEEWREAQTRTLISMCDRELTALEAVKDTIAAAHEEAASPWLGELGRGMLSPQTMEDGLLPLCANSADGVVRLAAASLASTSDDQGLAETAFAAAGKEIAALERALGQPFVVMKAGQQATLV